MAFFAFCIVFIIIDQVASNIYFKGDCHPLEALENLKDLPSWGPCLAFKNKSNDCGKGPETPFYINVNLLNKDGRFLRDSPPTIKWIDEWPSIPGYTEKNFPCIIDNNTVNPFTTFDDKRHKIRFNSDTVRKDDDKARGGYTETKPIQRFPLDTTTCAWKYGRYWGPLPFSNIVSYDLILNEFELPGCNDCACGSLDIYADNHYKLKLLERICSHNITKRLSFNVAHPPGYELLIHFKTNITTQKKLDIDVSTTLTSKYDEWTQCNMICGEGFQTRKIISLKECSATQYRSCWVGNCSAEEVATVEFNAKPVSSKCLNLMQETQEEFYSKREAVARDCTTWNGMDSMNLDLEEWQIMDTKSQLEQGRCKSNVTEECKTSFHDFITTITNIADNEELKKCINPSMIPRNPMENDRFNDFLHVMIPDMRDYIKFVYDIAEKSCKFL